MNTQTVSIKQKKSLFSKDRLSKAGPYLVAFFIPIIVMLIVFIERGIAPFGDKCFLRTDLYHQYAPFFQELKLKLSGGGSLLYDWNIGCGTAFLPIISYYLASPLNLLLLLCPQPLIIEFITYMIVFKIALCSLTFTYYVNKRHHKSRISGYGAAMFGIFYGLSGYMAAYSWNIMWLDCLWLFPLVILGIDRMFKQNKGLLYCITLGLTIFTNYYIAVMVCFGIFVYCFYLLATEKEMRVQFWNKFVKFLGYTILGVGMAAVLLIPYIHYFGMTASASSTFDWTDSAHSYFSIFDMFSRHLMNVEVHTGLDHWPNIYCGVLVFLMLPFYYLNKRITLKEKIASTLLLLFFYFSFSTRFMDYIWHVFHIPNSLPCRQAFIYIFFLLVLCYRGFKDIRERSYKEVGLVMIFGLLFTFAAEKLMMSETTFYSFATFYPSALFIVLYTILIYLYKKGKLFKDILLIITFTLITIEATINTSATSVTTVVRSDYTYFDNGVRTMMADINEKEGPNFFRVEKDENRTKNDGAWLNYHSISTFSSTANANLTTLYRKLGLESSMNAYGSKGQTPFTNMLLGVKYTVSMNELKGLESLRSLYNTNDTINMYANTYYMPIGFTTNYNLLSTVLTEDVDPLQVQNTLCEAGSGISDLFLDVTPTYEPSSMVTMMIPKDGYYFVYSSKYGPKEISVAHGDFNKTFSDLGRNYTIDIGYCTEGEVVTFSNTDTEDTSYLDLKLYQFQEDLMPTVYNAFKGDPLQVTYYDDRHLTGTINASEDSVLFTTIPFEDGWTVKVDGEQVNCSKAFDSFIAFDIKKGQHTIEFVYYTPLLTAGLLISLLCIAIVICIYICGKKQLHPFAKICSLIKKKTKPESDSI